ncbi:PLP-dependent aminotransferase family protein [Acidovorax sp. FJL06]|uniref:aminotransferase-like domain-containing protein n=1 Tax=Acidovorax sp. FJL06 TaxID=2153365 RepID=UPI000F566E27|nr:PLP-dependent aminotransferase family protein [Acidovorax sp. FJL06]RQO81382.1 GntR family transcriptional regulator [Acidovorax sp. FJL06]
MKRYERHADAMAQLIHSGALRPGDRIPSVREASRTRGISPSTVFEAYYLLEAQGLIHARPRSGYYVSARLPAAAGPRPAEPQPSQPAPTSTGVAVSGLVFEVLGLARERDLVPLGSAFPGLELFPLEPLARCLATGMRKLDPWNIVQSLPPGDERLRQQIALRYGLHGSAVDVQEIVITNGAMEALNLCLEAVTRPGDVVVVESPTFYAALQALERLNLQVLEIATHPRDGIDLNALAEALRRQPPHQPIKACWLMPSFQNPLGSLMPEHHKRALVALLARHQVPLIEDDVYGELHFAPQRPPPAKAFDSEGLVMHCSSFSKSLAPGYRVGWVAAGRFATAVQRLKLMTTLSAATPSQQALSEYLAQGGYDRHLRQLRRSLAQQQAMALAAVARHFPPGTRVSQPEGGYFLWVELPARVDALQLHHQALQRGISLAPGQIFSADRHFANCVRINYGHPAQTRFEAALTTVGALATALAAPGTAASDAKKNEAPSV